MANAKRDKSPTLNVTNHPRYQTVVELLASAKCGCGREKAKVKQAFKTVDKECA